MFGSDWAETSDLGVGPTFMLTWFRARLFARVLAYNAAVLRHFYAVFQDIALDSARNYFFDQAFLCRYYQYCVFLIRD